MLLRVFIFKLEPHYKSINVLIRVPETSKNTLNWGGGGGGREIMNYQYKKKERDIYSDRLTLTAIYTQG